MLPLRRAPRRDPGDRQLLRALLLALMLLFPPLAGAQSSQPLHNPQPLQFTDAQEEARFHALAAQLRCVQCQNQSLADSNAQIAQDLRREVLVLMQQGLDDARIKDFLVQRYGPFVLYQPPLQPGTWLLWGGPLLFLGGGAVLVLLIVRRRARHLAAGPPPADHGRADKGDDW